MEKEVSRRFKCPYCGCILLSRPGDTEEVLQRLHFSSKFEQVFDLGRCLQPFPELNPCYGKEIRLREGW